jgi:hypothetical protein
MIDLIKPKFLLGRVVATPGALNALEKSEQSPSEFLDKHVRGDWGIVCEEDSELNDLSLQDGSRILSAYKLRDGTKIWVITDAANDQGRREVTTILLPSEY